jgi:hypothetical protein
MQSPQEPTQRIKQPAQSAQNHITPVQWFQRNRQDVTITSLGEYSLPYFLAAIEACWVNAILIGLAGANLLGSPSALLPVWGPFVLFIASIWLFQRTLQKEAVAAISQAADEEQSSKKLPGSGLMIVVLGLLAFCLIWAHVYAGTFFLFDPAWLLSAGSDLLALNAHFYQALFVVAVTIYIGWRSIRLMQFTIEPGHIFRQLWVGLVIFLVAILFHANQTGNGATTDSLILLLLIPIFLYLALSAHALARVAFIRREHPFGLEGSTNDQERSMLSVISIVGLVLLAITIIGGIFFNLTFFQTLQPVGRALLVVYNGLISVLSTIMAFIAIPFFWLATWFFSHFPDTFPTLKKPAGVGSNPKILRTISPSSPAIVLTVKFLIPLLILLVLVLLVRVALRRRKRVRALLHRKGGDVHESVWSWGLFWRQFKAFWWSFFQRLFPHSQHTASPDAQIEETNIPPAARTVREIYRALLKKAASYGQIRKRDETPREFQQRLDARLPESEPNLGLLTEVYALTRYGGVVPDESELASLRNSWQELEQKWDQASQT